MGIWLAIGAPWVATDHAIRRTRAFGTETGAFVTMHLNENAVDNHLIQKRHGLDAIAYLEEIGFLGPDFLAIHCAVTSDAEIEVLARHDVKAACTSGSTTLVFLTTRRWPSSLRNAGIR
jgi:5-methylthioadenosine/S-adenosylhomocysteine deaminase